MELTQCVENLHKVSRISQSQKDKTVKLKIQDVCVVGIKC